MAKLFDSVAPLVKTISLAFAPMRLATCYNEKTTYNRALHCMVKDYKTAIQYTVTHFCRIFTLISAHAGSYTITFRGLYCLYSIDLFHWKDYLFTTRF
jgi:hypothetical protein